MKNVEHLMPEGAPKKYIHLWSNYIKRRWKVYLIGLFSVVLCNLMQVLGTRNMGWVVDFFTKSSIPAMLVQDSEEETFFVLFLVMLCSRVLLTIGRFGWRIFIARQTHISGPLLKTKIWEHVRYFKKNDLMKEFTKGSLMNLANSDTNAAKYLYGFTLVGAADTLFLGILTIGTMFFINIELTILSVVVLSALPFLIKKISTLEIKLYEDSQESLSTFNDLSSQVVNTVRLQRITQTEKYWENKLNESADTYRLKNLKAILTSIKYIPITGGVSLVCYISLFSVGTYLVINNRLSVGDFVTMQGLIFMLQDPLMEMGWVISDWRRGTTSLRRLDNVYSNNQESFLYKDGESIVSTDVVLEAKGLSKKFDDSEKCLFENIDLVLNVGDRLGVTGAIGTGKSILVQILCGLDREYGGDVLFHNKSYHDYKHNELRSYMSYVHQRPFLFADTIRNNISISSKFTDDEVWHFLDLAGLKNDIEKFEHQLDTPLGEWGINLSGGQKQRLTLARALARRPALLFLDDCLSAVDTVTEEKILQNLNRELKSTTLIWVAHRDSTLKYCNKFLKLGHQNV